MAGSRFSNPRLLFRRFSRRRVVQVAALVLPNRWTYGPFNKISGMHLAVDNEKCVDCGRCRKACPQGINPAATPAHSQCNRCLRCTGNCRFINLDLRL